MCCVPAEKTEGNLFKVRAETERDREGTEILHQIHQGECISSKQGLMCECFPESEVVTLTFTARHGGGGGGEREGFLQADPIYRETEQRGEREAQSPGEGGGQSG